MGCEEKIFLNILLIECIICFVRMCDMLHIPSFSDWRSAIADGKKLSGCRRGIRPPAPAQLAYGKREKRKILMCISSIRIRIEEFAKSTSIWGQIYENN